MNDTNREAISERSQSRDTNAEKPKDRRQNRKNKRSNLLRRSQQLLLLPAVLSPLLQPLQNVFEILSGTEFPPQQADLDVLVADGALAARAARVPAAAASGTLAPHLVLVQLPRGPHGGAVLSTVVVVALALQAASERSDGGLHRCELGLEAVESFVAAPEAVVELVQAGC